MQSYNRRAFLLTASLSVLPSGLRSFACDKGKQVPWLEEAQKVPEGLDYRSVMLKDEKGRPITNRQQWEVRRKQILQRWREAIGSLDVKKRPSNQLEVIEEDQPEGVIRQKVGYQSEPGESVSGYLIFPTGACSPRPGVVVLHQTTQHVSRESAGLNGNRAHAFGLTLAQQGFVTFSPDCFIFDKKKKYQQKVQEMLKRHPRATGMAKMLYDASRAVDILQSQKQVDAKRIGAVGHSLGAKEVLYLAAFDNRVGASVAHEIGLGFGMSNWADRHYLGKEALTRLQKGSHGHHELMALMAPRSFLLIGGGKGRHGDGLTSWPFVASALEIHRLYEKKPSFGFWNHGKGHRVIPRAQERITQWLKAGLGI